LALAGSRHIPFSSLDHEMAEGAFTFTSASKGWNVPGLKCGLAVVASAGNAAVLEERWEALIASHLGVLATIAAFSQAGDWLTAVRGQLAANRQILADLVGELLPGVGYVAPEASFLAWLDCRALDLGDDPSAVMLEAGRVALAAGPTFGGAGKGHVRLNIGTSPELIGEAVRRMRTACYSSVPG
jgi:cystathionine beta-lyase